MSASPIALATAAGFRLGGLTVTPSIRQVSGADGREATAEPRVLQVLIALVEANGAVVSRDTLIKRCWDGRVVGEDAINRSIAKVRLLADLTDPPAFSVETIPRVGYRLHVASPAPIGERGAEDEPPGKKPGTGSALAGEDRAPAGIRPALVGDRRVWLASLAGLLLICALGAAIVGLRPNTGARRIAVEPLRTTATDAPAEAVRLGLAGDLTHALAINPAHVSIDQAEKPGGDPAAAFALTGDAATIDDRLQAHVQLSSRHGGAILWAGDFVGDPSHPETLSEQIATKTDAVISCGLSGRHLGRARIDDEAARLYLKACDLIEQFRVDDALIPLQQLTALKPGFARAWADLATTQAMVVFVNPGRQTNSPEDVNANARRALAIDPKTGLAYYAMASVVTGPGAWRRRFDIIDQGLKVEPDSSELNNAMAAELMEVGRTNEALAYFRRSMAADPLNPVKTATLFKALAAAGQMDEAETLIRKALRLWRRNAFVWTSAFATELRFGDPNAVEAMLADKDRPAMLDPKEIEAARAWLLARRDPARASVDAATAAMPGEEPSGPGQDALPAATRLAEVGRIDLAYALALDPGAQADQVERNDALAFERALSKFQADPRFVTLMKHRGLIPIWRGTGHWPDFCADRSPPNDCRTLFAGS